MKMSRIQLAAYLKHMRDRVLTGDSLEGTISYTTEDGVCGPGEFLVEGAYRIGQLEGQGRMKLIGKGGEVAAEDLE